jgi:hypothetical protein
MFHIHKSELTMLERSRLEKGFEIVMQVADQDCGYCQFLFLILIILVIQDRTRESLGVTRLLGQGAAMVLLRCTALWPCSQLLKSKSWFEIVTVLDSKLLVFFLRWIQPIEL